MFAALEDVLEGRLSVVVDVFLEHFGPAKHNSHIVSNVVADDPIQDLEFLFPMLLLRDVRTDADDFGDLSVTILQDNLMR